MARTQIRLHEDMGAAVLQKLQGLADLSAIAAQMAEGPPMEAFVAGQAVASAVSELFGDGSATAYNDVDVFQMYRHDGDEPAWVEYAASRRKALPTLGHYGAGLGNHYGQIIWNSRRVYAVRATSRAGALNEVACVSDFWHWGTNASRLFLRSFDLNCVQVAVRLSDGKLVWTPEFESFLPSKQLLVTNVGTPVHTAVRWFKKRAELAGVYGNDELAMETLAAATLRYVTDRRENSENVGYERTLTARLTMGRQYTDKASSVMGELGKWMRIEGQHGRPEWLKTLMPIGMPGIDLLAAPVPTEDLALYAAARRGVYRKRICNDVQRLLAKPREDVGRVNLLREGVSLLQTGRSQNEAGWIEAELKRHIGLLTAMALLTQAQQVWFFSALRKLQREGKAWAYGVLDRRGECDATQPLQATKSEEDMLAALREITQRELAKIELEQPPQRPALKAAHVENYAVHELRTFQALWNEGEYMEHCVGGYWGAVVDGATRIFSLRPERERDRLTLRAVWRREGRWVLAECKKRFNVVPDDTQMQTAQRVVEVLNRQTIADAAGRKRLGLWLRYVAATLDDRFGQRARSTRMGRRTTGTWQRIARAWRHLNGSPRAWEEVLF